LVVEDVPDVGRTFCALLEVFGHDVELAPNGVEALEALAERGANVVICDIGLPGMSGHEFARRVRSAPELADVCLIAVTGRGGPEQDRLSAEAGFDFHLLKPVSIDEIQRLMGSDRTL
tara:strand:+ start:393 stop:746 length:354 start_codon:yes stop_codon:yes gene_type:complete